MKTWCKPWLAALLCLLGACVDSECPKGSREVDGVCKTIDDGAGGAGAGGDGTGIGPQAGIGGTGADAGDSSADAATDASQEPPPVRCEDLDCDDDAHCDDSEPDARCVCEDGYEGDGISCEDIDECDEDSDDCDGHAECTNTDGGFTCECEPGYEGDGKSCDANPCEPRVDPCDADTSSCDVEDGEAVCTCKEGRDRCDDDPHACTTDLTDDEDNCGECGAGCAGSLECEEGVCEQLVVKLDLGSSHSCALAPDGEILCWGRNDYGQLSREAGASQPTYEPAPTKLGAARSMSAGTEATCALLKEDDELVCFGQSGLYWIDNGAGQGDFSLGTGLTDIDAVAVGLLHACVQDDGSAFAWGINNLKVLGESAGATEFPMRIERSQDVTMIAAGVGVCAIGDDERVRCWGNDVATATEIVDGTDEPIEGARHVALSLSNSASCAAIDDGRVMCWGDNQYGQLGNVGVTDDSSELAVPVTDESGTPFDGLVEVAVGTDFACARHEDGHVWCWGRRDRLGSGATGTTVQRYPAEVSGIEDAIEISVGATHACARRRSGQVQCWGNNANGQLGVNPSLTSSSEPVDVIGLP